MKTSRATVLTLWLSLSLYQHYDPPVNWAKEYTTAFSDAQLSTYILSLKYDFKKSANRTFLSH